MRERLRTTRFLNKKEKIRRDSSCRPRSCQKKVRPVIPALLSQRRLNKRMKTINHISSATWLHKWLSRSHRRPYQSFKRHRYRNSNRKRPNNKIHSPKGREIEEALPSYNKAATRRGRLPSSLTSCWLRVNIANRSPSSVAGITRGEGVSSSQHPSTRQRRYQAIS